MLNNHENARVLLDLERTVKTGIAHYWKAGRRGYTTIDSEVGVYFIDEAQELVEKDFDKLTVSIPYKKFKGLTFGDE